MQSVIHLWQETFHLVQPIRAVQNDTGRELKMIIEDVAYGSGASGTICLERMDGSCLTIATTFDVSDNSFTADITQALTEAGGIKCQLKVTYNSKVVSSYTFYIFVQEGVLCNL